MRVRSRFKRRAEGRVSYHLYDARSRLFRADGAELVVFVGVNLRHARLHEARVEANNGNAARLHVEGEDLAHHVLRAFAHVVPDGSLIL